MALLLPGAPAIGQAKPPGRIPQVAICLFQYVPLAELEALSFAPARDFVNALRERGWEDGKNVHLIFWSASDNGQPQLRSKLCIDAFVGRPIDLIVVYNRGEYAVEKLPGVPVVSLGLNYEAKQHPRLTGVSYAENVALQTKRYAMLAEATGAKRLISVILASDSSKLKPGLGPPSNMHPTIQAAARTLKVTIQPLVFTSPDQIERAIASIADGRTAVVIGNSQLWVEWEGAGKVFHDSLLKHRIASMAKMAGAAKFGAMIGYGAKDGADGERLPYLVDRILRGTPPAELPVEQMNQYRLEINLEVARRIGVTIPRAVLLQADAVHESIELPGK